MTVPADCPEGTIWCGELRREPDGRWFFGPIFLGRDGQPQAVAYDLDDRLGIVAARLAEALHQSCAELERWGDVVASSRGREVLRRFERWKEGRPW